MSTVSLSITGSKAISDYLTDAPDLVKAAVGEELSDFAAELEGDIVLRIQQGSKTGRVYRRGQTVHKASAPGEAPASDTGNLMKSIYSEKASQLTYVVGSRIVYALYLEYGTVKMAARPFFTPAVEGMKDELNPRLKAVIDGVLK